MARPSIARTSCCRTRCASWNTRWNADKRAVLLPTLADFPADGEGCPTSLEVADAWSDGVLVDLDLHALAGSRGVVPGTGETVLVDIDSQRGPGEQGGNDYDRQRQVTDQAGDELRRECAEFHRCLLEINGATCADEPRECFRRVWYIEAHHVVTAARGPVRIPYAFEATSTTDCHNL